MRRRLTPEQAVAELRRTVPVLEEESEHAMRDAVELTFMRLTEQTPRGESGDLARDVIHTVRKTATGISGLVRPRKRYARYVEGGTGEGNVIRTGAKHSAGAGRAYDRSGHVLTAGEEIAHPFDVMTASGWGSKTPGRPLALHLRGGVLYRSRVRGQRARGFVQRTREIVADEVERRLIGGAQRASERLFK